MPAIFMGRTPRPSQVRICKARERFIVAAGNRYPGKTTASLWRIMDFCLVFPRCEGFMGRWFKKNLYGTTLALWRKLFPFPEWADVFDYKGGTELEPEYIQFKNGSLIYLVPLQHHEEKLRGGNFNFGLIDQMEECPKKVWTQAVASVREEPMWTEDRNGKLVRYEGVSRRFVLATVNKTREWYWIKRMFKDFKDVEPEDRSKYLLIENAWDENKEAVNDGFYRDLKANATSDAQIAFEVYGEDPSEFGLVFPDFGERTHTKKFEFTDDVFKNASFYLGYDEGWNPDPSAFIFLAITPDGTHWYRAEHMQARWTISKHAAKLEEIAAKIGFPLTAKAFRPVADPTIIGKRDGYGVSIADQWGALDRKWSWEGGTRDEIGSLSLMKTLMQPDESGKHRFWVHSEDCPNLTEQLAEAEYDPDRPGAMFKRCVVHCLDAARYPTAASKTPLEYRPPPETEGKWAWDQRTHKLSLAPKGKSWLAPSRGEQDWPLVAPRRDQS